VVESLRPYLGADDLHRDLELVDELAAAPDNALQLLVDLAPGVFRAGWALLVTDEGVVAHSPGSPELDQLDLLPVTTPRRVPTDEAWVPARWDDLGVELAVAPVGDPGTAVLLGRPGGPRFRDSEVMRLAHLAGIAATVRGTILQS
jgi:hypothetical protein